MANDVEVTDDVLAGLVSKLRSLDLSDDESAVLGSLLVTAANQQSDVSGFGVVFQVETTFKGTDEELQVLFRSAVPAKVPRMNAIFNVDPLGRGRSVVRRGRLEPGTRRALARRALRPAGPEAEFRGVRRESSGLGSRAGSRRRWT